MDDRTRVIIVIVVLLVVGFPLIANLAGGKKAEQPAAPAPANTATPLPPAPSPQPAPQAMTPSPAQPINVANTAWTINHREYGNVTVQFLPNGAAVVQSDKLPTQIQGTWQQNGSSVNVTVPMGSITAQVQGDQLIAEGQAARRLR